MKKYEITYERNYREHKLVRHAESATAAADKVCDQYGWSWRYGKVSDDADSRGAEWAELPCDPNGGIDYTTTLLIVSVA